MRPFLIIAIIAYILYDWAFPADAHSWSAVVAIAAYVYTAIAMYVGASAAVAIGYVVGVVVVGAVLVGASMAVQALTGGSGGPDRIQDYSSSAFAKGLLLNKSGNTEPIPLVYGSRRVGGCRVFMEAEGTNNQYLHMILAIAEGPISAINEVYLTQVPTTDPKYDGFVDVYKHLGAPDQAADADLISACPSWTAAHKLSGVAYLHIRLKYDYTVFASGLPVVTADIDGKMVYDPRDEEIKFSRNPALCIRDYLTNTLYGRGIPEAQIDDASFIVAANYCDEEVTVGGNTQARYTCDGGVNVDDTALSNVDKLLASCRGMLIFSGGRYRLLIDKPETPVAFAFNESNITGSWTISLGNKKNMFNRIRARFFNPARSWAEDIAIVDSPGLRELDNGLLLEKTIELPFTSNIDTARQIATINVNQSRQQIACSFTAFISGMRCEVGDVVPITHSTPGWSAKLFRIVGMALKGNDEVTVTAIEYDATVYDFGVISVVDATPNTNIPGPNDPVPSVSGVSHEEEVYYYRDRSFTRWKVFFSPPPVTTYPFWDHADIYLKIADGEWKYMTKSGGNYQVDPVEEGVQYWLKMVSTSIWGSKEPFDGAYTVSKIILGKTDVPSNPTNMVAAAAGDTVTIFATQLTEPDVAGYEVRAGNSWDGSILCGFNETPNFRFVGVRPGTHTFWLKAYSNTGKYSGAALSKQVTVFYPSNYTDKNTWLWDFDAIGTHDNTEMYEYAGVKSLRCAHTDDVLTGTWTSPEYDLGSLKDVRVWGDFITGLESGELTWAALFGETTKWEDKISVGQRWYNIFVPSSTGNLTARIYYGTSSGNLTDYLDRFELFSPEFSARYVKIVITITDPDLSKRFYVNRLNMKAAFWR